MKRTVRIDTPLGEGAILFRSLRGREEMGRLFELELELLSAEDNVDFTAVIGKPMTVQLELGSGEVRHFNGICSRFAQGGGHGRHMLYRATLRPWLWLLTRTADCRIFQGKTAPEIIKEVFRDLGLTEFSESLGRSYRTREYCVQYRETDFAFVSRLMEEEGIYYFFEHEPGKHTLVLADSYSAHSAAPGYDEIPFFPESEKARRERDHIDRWSASEQLEPGAYFLEDFDFERPKANLEVKLASQHELAKSDYEIYDYPGAFTQSTDGETYVRIRLEELYARQASSSGEGNARGISPGSLFKLTNFARADQNKEYLTVSADYQLDSDAHESTPSDSGPVFRCKFSAIDSQRPFRSARSTPRPVIQGPQTAIVVGKQGEEIWTDEHGRVKLQFHWDRLGKQDEKSSCWVRVAQVWAGGKWGGIQIPRIGQEVVVEFLDGDPDRPIVTGRVYNGDLKVPYALPTNQTQSGIKSRSTKQGNDDNYNEIRFEDKKGSEQIHAHAEKDLVVTVENDARYTVGHDRIEEVQHDETITVKGNRTETVEKDETISVTGARTESVGKDEAISIGANRSEAVGKNEEISIGANRAVTVAKDEEISVGGSQAIEIGKDADLTIGGQRTVSVGKNDKLEVSQKLTISAGQELVLKVGAASITMKANGDVVIKGVNVTVDGSATTKIKASGAVDIMGNPISHK